MDEKVPCSNPCAELADRLAVKVDVEVLVTDTEDDGDLVGASVFVVVDDLLAEIVDVGVVDPIGDFVDVALSRDVRVDEGLDDVLDDTDDVRESVGVFVDVLDADGDFEDVSLATEVFVDDGLGVDVTEAVEDLEGCAVFDTEADDVSVEDGRLDRVEDNDCIGDLEAEGVFD